MTRTTLSTIHTADLHLDNNIGARGDESAGQLGMMAVVDKALELDVDLFLLAGDLFDHNRVKESCLEFASEQLARLRCPVVMVAGNHDCLADHSVYHRYDPCEAGDHIHFIRDEDGGILELPSLGVRVWGQGIVDHDPDNKPMESAPARDGDSWYIGLTHGYYVARGGGMFSSLITPEEISRSDFDYLALGHVHVFDTMEHDGTRAAYSGSPNRDQGIREMSAAHITFDPASGVTVSKVLLE